MSLRPRSDAVLSTEAASVDPETRARRYLAREVLRSAIDDMRSASERARRLARLFVLDESCAPLLRLWCDVADIDVEALRDRVRTLMAQNERRDRPTSVASPPVPVLPIRPSSASGRVACPDGWLSLRRSNALEEMHVQP